MIERGDCMTERERLIQLLKTDNCPSPFVCDANCKYIDSENCSAERIADYLLENRVSILPCKVGDALYYHDYKCGAFNDNKDEWNIIDSIVCEIRIKKKGTLVVMSSGRIFTHKDFGKTIFNTKEDAEKALLERSEHSD